MSNRRFDEKTVQSMYKMYSGGKTQREVAEAFGTTQDRVSSLFRSRGLSCKRGRRRRCREMDCGYFGRIDRSDKAYFLGIVISDGSVRYGSRNELRVTVARNDRYLLEILRHAMGCDTPIRDCGGDRSQTSSLSLCSKELVGRLRQYGIPERKDGALKLPVLSSDMMPHLLRGLLDGGGWVSRKSRSVGFCGPESLVGGVRTFLMDVLKVSPNRIVADRGVAKVSWANPTDFARICAYLYEDKGDCYLLRKYYEFVETMRQFSERGFRLPSRGIRVRQFAADGAFVREFEDCSHAASELGLPRQNILLCCKKAVRTCGGFTFRFNLNDYFSKVPEAHRTKSVAFSEKL